jgi:predicted Zn-dependent protease
MEFCWKHKQPIPSQIFFMQTLKSLVQFGLLYLILIVGALSCTRNALTGKKQLTIIPEGEIQSLASGQYKDFLKAHPVVAGQQNAQLAMVKRVGERITQAVNRYYAGKNMSGVLTGYKWEYNLVDDATVNAWCMPGGKIVVYTGLLPIAVNENALAVVMGHEVSHALLQHGNQRMSSSMLQQFGGITLAVALSSKPAQTQNLFLQAYGIGSEVGVMLPFSRKHELEADRYGLIWAAMAGYDPNEALAFWDRMEKASGGNQVPDFLRTHPTDAVRKEKIKSYLPEALTYKGK